MRINRLAAVAVMAIACLAGRNARADGVTDILIDPAAGITISVPGSYRLAGNVTMTANANAVTVNANDVTLDLNGHTITGAAGNTSLGISAPAVSDVTVMNGGLADFGNSAVAIATRGTLRGLTVRNCARIGIAAALFLGSEGRIADCSISEITPAAGSAIAITVGANSSVTGNVITVVTAANSPATGISAGLSSIIEGNRIDAVTSNLNGAAQGISASDGAIIRANRITGIIANGTGAARGIQAGTSCLIESNVCTSSRVLGAGSSNHATGISTSQSTVLNNVCSDNLAGAGTNGFAYGINSGASSRVTGNYCASNTANGTGFAAGIFGNSGGHVESNTLRDNTGGARSWGIRCSSTSNYVADNFAQGNGTAGLRFDTDTSNRTERNRLRQSTGIDLGAGGVLPESEGAGELADLVY